MRKKIGPKNWAAKIVQNWTKYLAQKIGQNWAKN